MTGEMLQVNPDEYPLHFAVAEEFGGTVMPFDKYQGPYVAHAGNRYFLSQDNGLVYWINQTTERFGGVFDPEGEDAEKNAIASFRDLLKGGGSIMPPGDVVHVEPREVVILLRDARDALFDCAGECTRTSIANDAEDVARRCDRAGLLLAGEHAKIAYVMAELGESLTTAFQKLAVAEGVALDADSEDSTIEFNRQNARLRRALHLFYQWHDRDGMFRKGAEPREGMPAEYRVVYQDGFMWEAETEVECQQWVAENRDRLPGLRIEPGALFWRRAEDVVPGDYLDLEGDIYCDPQKSRSEFQSELVLVADVATEGQTRVIYVEGVAPFGMPADHLLKVQPGEPDED